MFKKGDEVIYQSTTQTVLDYGKKYIVDYTNSMTGWIGLENHIMNFDPKDFELVKPPVNILQNSFTLDDLETGMYVKFRDYTQGVVMKGIGITVNSSNTLGQSVTYKWKNFTQSLEYDNPFNNARHPWSGCNANQEIMKVMLGFYKTILDDTLSPYEIIWTRLGKDVSW